MNPGIFSILIGIFTLICTLTKPNFYWNSRKATRLRRFLGDGGATIVYFVLSAFFIVLGIYMLISGQTL